MNQGTPSRIRFAEYRKRRAADRTRPNAILGISAFDRSSTANKFVARQRTTLELVRTFWRLLGRQRKATLFSLGLLTVAVVLGLLPLYMPKIVIDSVLDDKPVPEFLAPFLPNGSYALLIWLVAVFVCVLSVSQFVRLWAGWQAARAARRVQAEVRRKTFEHACLLPLHRVLELKSGGVASLLREDAGAVGNLVLQGLFNPWNAIVQLLGSLAVLTFIDWRLLLVGLFVIPGCWITHRTWMRYVRPLWRDVRYTRLQVDSHATEVFGGMRIVRAFGRRRAETAAFVRQLNLIVRQELYTWWWMRTLDTFWSISVPVGTGILLLLGSWQVLSDREAVASGMLPSGEAFTTGALIAFLTYLAAMMRPVSTLAATATELQNALAGLDRTLDLLEEEVETHCDSSVVKLPTDRIQGAIRIEKISFRYPHSTRNAVSDITLDAPPGTTTAFVGPSGSGKSTLCNLIACFYQPTAGRILLDGVDLRNIDLDAYRRLLGIVEQDIFLFDGAISENIAYSGRNFTEADIRNAAKLSNAHEFIAQLPNGYDTVIGERGVRLSTGQRQRLAIARAVLSDPKILILDEATSALDTESERLVQASLAELMTKRTSFVIAHRLSTITHADQIVVLEAGRIVERGTHSELIRTSGHYRHMIELQILNTSPTGELRRTAGAPANA